MSLQNQMPTLSASRGPDADTLPDGLSVIRPMVRRKGRLLTRTRGATGVKIRDMMSVAPAVLLASSKIRTAVEVLQSLDLRSLPVVDDEGVLVGTLSDRELRALRIPYFVGTEYVGDLRTVLEMATERLMNREVAAVDVDGPVTEAITRMLVHNRVVVPVTNRDGVLVGVISCMDLLVLLPIEAESAGSAA